MKTLRRIALPGICLALPLLCSAQPQEAPPSESPPAVKDTRIEQMNPFTVSALYAAVEVEFTLSGKTLFNPLEDTVVSAEIMAVVIRDPDDIPEIKVGDRIVTIDGVELKGKTLGEISTLLSEARGKGVPEWQITRTLGLRDTFVKFDGDWLVPLPGLKR